MANHGFVYLKTRVTVDRLYEEMQKINEDRFKGKIEIEKSGDYCNIKFYDCYDIHFWIAHPRKIEHRHGPGGDLRWWIEIVFANDLAVALNGLLGDEGCDGKWKPEKGKYPTLKDMVMSFQKDYNGNKGLISCYFANMSLKHALKMRPDLAEFIGKAPGWWETIKATWVKRKDGESDLKVERKKP